MIPLDLAGSYETVCGLDDDDGVYAEYRGPKPATLIVNRGGHGHVYFKHTERSRELGNISQKTARGRFSFRAHNEYLVGPGSAWPDKPKRLRGCVPLTGGGAASGGITAIQRQRRHLAERVSSRRIPSRLCAQRLAQFRCF